MKTIGLIGGMSWESSLEYYRLVNEGVKARLGGYHSARCVMVSVDFAEIEAFQRSGEWDQAARVLVAAACALERSGADCVVLCTNTMHLVAESIQSAVEIPFLHIADATAEKICKAGIRRIGLLGTRFTMEEDFYKQRLADRFGLEVLIPDKDQRDLIHRVIYDELVMGIILEDSRRAFQSIIASLIDKGAQAIILGCTEIGLLIKPGDSPVPLFDTTLIHAEAAVNFCLAGDYPNP
ncbi:MAG TPA: aspartate/glutamate racemase family protein [Anaerolineaceae bacterium]|nr:aspartate/glutamate racemase family protein [Anaerolineaceae bacterium]